VIDSGTNATLTLHCERAVSTTATGLTPDRVYHVRVRARSTEGSGPWSDNFTAQTLATGDAMSDAACLAAFINLHSVADDGHTLIWLEETNVFKLNWSMQFWQVTQ